MATFFYDLGSPYAWLTAERIRGAEWVPVLLGGIFRATGRSSWARTERREEGIAEVERRARERGLPAPRWADPWPNDGLLAMRAATYADLATGGTDPDIAGATRGTDPNSARFALEAFRVQFVDGRALSDPANVALAAERAGLDPDAVLAATRDDAVKAKLRENTDRALAAGVFGVPALVLRTGGLLWGDDAIGAAGEAHGGRGRDERGDPAAPA